MGCVAVPSVLEGNKALPPPQPRHHEQVGYPPPTARHPPPQDRLSCKPVLPRWTLCPWAVPGFDSWLAAFTAIALSGPASNWKPRIGLTGPVSLIPRALALISGGPSLRRRRGTRALGGPLRPQCPGWGDVMAPAGSWPLWPPPRPPLPCHVGGHPAARYPLPTRVPASLRPAGRDHRACGSQAGAGTENRGAPGQRP